jgi:TolB-like protein/Tfp pilus assembly protein PilF
VFRGGPIDARLDIWALGIMLYQMAGGRLPFAGDTSFSTAHAILDDDPAPLPDAVPLSLRAVIARCLAKDPAARYQTAGDLRASLISITDQPHGVHRARARLLAAVTVAVAVAGPAYLMTSGGACTVSSDPARHVLAVLPFRDAAGDASFLADGTTEALIAEMGRLDAVRVIAAGTSARFRLHADAVGEVARETGATYVLEGTIGRSGQHVRLSLRLTEAATRRPLWSEEYERHTRDLDALYGSIAGSIAEAMAIRVDVDDTRRLSLRRAVDPDVYEAFLKGRYHWNRRTNESLAQAIDQFETAIRLDPTFAPAYAALADCYNQLGTVMVGGGSPQQWRPRAAEMAIKALQIDPELAEAHATLGYVRHYSGEWAAAEKSLQRALVLNPSNTLGRIWYANYLSSRGRADEAIREVRLAEQLDPLSPIVGTNVGWVLINARRYDEAIDQLRRTIALDTAYPQAHSRLGAAYSFNQQHELAIAESELTVTLSQRSPASLVALAQAYALAGRTREAEDLLNQRLADLPNQYVASGAIANVYAAMGRRDEALTWLERSLQERTNNIAYLAVEPVYDGLRDDPRFQDILRRAGLP